LLAANLTRINGASTYLTAAEELQNLMSSAEIWLESVEWCSIPKRPPWFGRANRHDQILIEGIEEGSR